MGAFSRQHEKAEARNNRWEPRRQENNLEVRAGVEMRAGWEGQAVGGTALLWCATWTRQRFVSWKKEEDATEC